MLKKINLNINNNNDDVVNLVKFNEKLDSFSNKDKTDNILIKCILLGDSNAGKTTFINYIQGKTNKKHIPTVGVERLFFNANINGKNVYIQITDTCGQERFRSITKSQLNNVDVILLFYDITNRESFESLDYWFETIDNSIDLKDISLILVANKIDENKQRKVSKDEGLKIAEEKKFKYYECSSLNGLNVYEILNELILEGYNTNNKKQEQKILNESSESFISQSEKVVTLVKENKEGGFCCSSCISKFIS